MFHFCGGWCIISYTAGIFRRGVHEHIHCSTLIDSAKLEKGESYRFTYKKEACRVN